MAEVLSKSSVAVLLHNLSFLPAADVGELVSFVVSNYKERVTNETVRLELTSNFFLLFKRKSVDLIFEKLNPQLTKLSCRRTTIMTPAGRNHDDVIFLAVVGQSNLKGRFCLQLSQLVAEVGKQYNPHTETTS